MKVPRTEDGARAGLSLAGIVTLTAIGSVLVLVTLSRLRGFVVLENEQDALSALRLVAAELVAADFQAADPASIQSLVERAELGHSLSDAKFLDDGRVMQRHGYFFELVPVPGEPDPASALPSAGLRGDALPGARESAPSSWWRELSGSRVVEAGSGGGRAGVPRRARLVLRAWPCVSGDTGTAALLATSQGELFGHPNRALAWGGLESPPPIPLTRFDPQGAPGARASAPAEGAYGSFEPAELGWRALR